MERAKVLNLNQYRAQALVEDGKHLISVGDLDGAVDAFQRAIELHPIADAYSYMGWVLSLKGQTDQAILLCKTAIELDPDFGNPYNDIGSYLIQKNQLEDAIPWLQKAKNARRYEPRHFPHINLGRIYSAQGRISDAISEFRQALTYAPEHQEIQKVLEQLEKLQDSSI